VQQLDGSLSFHQSTSSKWQYRDPETKSITDEFDDPVAYQKFMMQRSPIIHSTAS
jgi:hypothetical protein